MGARLDLVGQRFGRLTVLEYIPLKGREYWKCRCDCGKEKNVRVDHLTSGNPDTKSCGCFSSDFLRERSLIHGMAAGGYITKEYNAWVGMKRRCYNKNTKDYPRYGGRGITVCPEWLNDVAQFYADMGTAPSPKHSLDRINNDGNYEPSNCRWSTAKEQANNRRISSTRLTFDGRTQTLKGWAEELNMTPTAIQTRIQRGWTVDEALSTPVQKKRIIK